MPAAPPPGSLPDWKAVTMVEPKPKLSGSDLRLALRIGQSQDVLRELPRDDLAVGGDHVRELRVDRVEPATARHRVPCAVGVHGDAVVPRRAEDHVPARPAVQEIGPAPSFEPVVSTEAVHRVAGRRSQQAVRTGGAAGARGAGSTDRGQRSDRHPCQDTAGAIVTLDTSPRTEMGEGFVFGCAGIPISRSDEKGASRWTKAS